MGRRRWTAAGALIGSIALTGCVGSTEPATDIARNGATLNARGTANNGPATSFFEYWLTGASAETRRTRDLFWPAGASGRFSETVAGLAGGLSYSFRVCGADDGQSPVCAQTRSFTTVAPTEDAVRGSNAGGCCTSVTVDATSGPAGERPRGSVNRRSGSSFSPTSLSFIGFVTCLEVDGNRGVIGAVGQERESPSGKTRPATTLITVVDGRIAGDEVSLYSTSAGSTPPDCGAGPAAVGGGSLGDLLVDDAAAR